MTFDIDGTVVHATCAPRFTAGKIALRSYGSEGVFDDLKLWRPGPGTLVDLVLNVPSLPAAMEGASYPTQYLTASGGTTKAAITARPSSCPNSATISN